MNLRKLFGEEMLEIHHFDSPSIPGMDAKPINGMLMAARDLQKIGSYNQEMQRTGYIPKGESGIPGRRFFFKGDEFHHSHHLHVFQ